MAKQAMHKWGSLAAALTTILLASSSAAQTVETPAEADNSDIVVVARQLELWRGAVRDRSGVIECRTVRTSGAPDIDAIGCRALQECFVEHRPSLTAAANSERRGRRQRVAQADRELHACLVDRRTRYIELHVADR